MQVEDFSQELLSVAKEMKELAFEYKKARADFASAFNKITVLIQEAGLAQDKSSFENKIPKLISIPEYNELATQLACDLKESEQLYKGLEQVLKAYQAHISALQSTVKFMQMGEINHAVSMKYGRGEG